MQRLYHMYKNFWQGTGKQYLCFYIPFAYEKALNLCRPVDPNKKNTHLYLYRTCKSMTCTQRT